MKSKYDIIVIGARVAGSATALLLSRLGYRVLIVDRNHPTTDTLSTHAIVRTGVLQLQRWGVLPSILARGTPPMRQVTLGFGEQRISFDFRTDYGVTAMVAPRRPVLDTILLETAVAAGADFRQGERMVDLDINQAGQVTAVTLANGKGQTTLSAQFVVGADGLRSRVAALVGAASYEAHPPANVMTYGYFAGVDNSHYVSQFNPGCATGFFPTNDGLTCVFAARPLGAGPIKDGAEFQHIIETASPEMGEQLRGSQQVGRFYRSMGIPGFLRVPGGRGWALVGDAGFTKDPLSARGISDAFRDAELAARAIDGVLSGRQNTKQAMNDYQATRDRFALPIQQATRSLAHFTWDEAEASALLRQLGKIIDEECRFLSQLDPLAGPTDPTGLATLSGLPQTASILAV
ncbi:MAG: NAD(P)/FAD-dependent oxidoreductase [Chloroflexota bacterium]|jgi:2-polyprenyl-6-methoxyphenol hydroxylase-like FAD-dependent oxidoreductase